ncbi:hypothetical protein B296_00043259, partial [Ensete ventricosum]
WKRLLTSALSHYCLVKCRTHVASPVLPISLGASGPASGRSASTSSMLDMQ